MASSVASKTRRSPVLCISRANTRNAAFPFSPSLTLGTATASLPPTFAEKDESAVKDWNKKFSGFGFADDEEEEEEEEEDKGGGGPGGGGSIARTEDVACGDLRPPVLLPPPPLLLPPPPPPPPPPPTVTEERKISSSCALASATAGSRVVAMALRSDGVRCDAGTPRNRSSPLPPPLPMPPPPLRAALAKSGDTAAGLAGSRGDRNADRRASSGDLGLSASAAAWAWAVTKDIVQQNHSVTGNK